MAKEEAQVNESQFLKRLNKNKAAAKAAAKAERPTGIMDDSQIMEALGLTEEGDRITLSARVSKIAFNFAKKDTNRPYFQFRYAFTANSPNSDKGKGLIVSNYIELTEGVSNSGEVYRTEEQAYESLFYEFQGIGDDTKGWTDPLKEALASAKKHTAEKTEVTVTVSVYKSNRTQELGMNIRVNPLLTDDSDLEDEEPDNEDIESSEEENEEEEGSYTDWIDGWVAWTDDEGTVEFQVESYDEDSNTFSGKDEADDEYTDVPADECEWAEDQREDD